MFDVIVVGWEEAHLVVGLWVGLLLLEAAGCASLRPARMLAEYVLL
jgi:hypothetical protein